MPNRKVSKAGPTCNPENVIAALGPGQLPGDVKKEIIHIGKGPIPDYQPGSRVTFHFKTVLPENPDKVLDDSRTMSKPMELIIGKKFKIEIWEAMVKTMMIGEVSSFVVPQVFVTSYPLLSKTLRDSQRPKENVSHHCCGMMSQGCGYHDLDKLLEKPTDLIFTFDILRVERGGEYKQESWQLTDDERLASIPTLKEEGNAMFSSGDYKGAKSTYYEAIARLEQLALREKPGSEEVKELEEVKVPLLLNYALCLMKAQEYYAAIEHLSTVLKIEPENVKGYFRRGICHGKVGDFEQGREDLYKAENLDETLKKNVMTELKLLSEYESIAVAKERERTKKMFAN